MEIVKPLAEVRYKKEIDALIANDKGNKVANWKMSPKQVCTFILGSDEPLIYNNEEVYITKKFYGDNALVERSIITLAGNRGLMLIGEPGTAKSMLSELLSAAISGISTNTIQGTAGTTDDMIKYSWNYALLLSKGPTIESLVPAPLYNGMKHGIITRFEEITRCPLEIQDSIISVMSDKILNIPELKDEPVLMAHTGFNMIATANTRDKGINEMSSALKRRFNFETIRPISNISLEVQIIEKECKQLLKENNVKEIIDIDIIKVLATTFSELRNNKTDDNIKLNSVSSVLSTAEAVSVYFQSVLDAYYYNDNQINIKRLIENIKNTIIKDNYDDLSSIKSYFKTVVKSRSEQGGVWLDYYNASTNVL